MVNLVHGSDKALTSVSSNVESGEDLSELVLDMKLIMAQAGGIGLAANQVGVLKRVIIVSTKDFSGEIINPVITRSTDTIKISGEGCLSFPGKSIKKKRNYKVTVEGFDAKWNPVKVNAKGLTSYCLQHEIDHLNGIVI